MSTIAYGLFLLALVGSYSYALILHRKSMVDSRNEDTSKFEENARDAISTEMTSASLHPDVWLASYPAPDVVKAPQSSSQTSIFSIHEYEKVSEHFMPRISFVKNVQYIVPAVERTHWIFKNEASSRETSIPKIPPILSDNNEKIH